MRKEFIGILACPVCKGPLTLDTEDERDGDIVRGSLHCAKCNERYPIEDSVPNLLPPPLRAS